jgi:NADH dehydrogenase subunit L (EC 1.6.5.3)
MVGAYSPLVVALPFAAFVIAVAAGGRLPRKGAVIGSIATLGALVLSVLLAISVAASGAYTATIWRWAAGADGVTLSFGVLIDPLSTMMLIIVSLIALLVHVFSLGYMNAEGEEDLPRYYAGLGLFTASMLGFVIADNLLMAFIFFELVGLCSYLLIGFWYREEAPPSAAKKAFLVTRFGDYFFLIGVVAVFATFGTARFVGPMAFPILAEAAIAGEVAVRTFGFSPQTWITVVGLLILGGVLGKSAQFPLHTWLPDAMEGPTPVSALIHAATMVAAGVYLVARMYGFYAVSPDALAIIALVGGFTALFAATMGVVKREIKQVLAYSTISQYGYMLLGLGAGGYVAATFHLLTHAFFKALLFLGAGAVIIAMHHHEDMWEMGGLRRRMPVTYVTFLAGSLALAGIVPFAGFWSKDEILYETLIHALGGSSVLVVAFTMGLLAVVFTGFYTFRMVMLTFHGSPRSSHAKSPQSVGMSMRVPLVILGVLAVTAGAVNAVPLQKLTGLTEIDFLHQWLDGGAAALSAHHYAELLPYASAYLGGGPATTVLIGAGASLALAGGGALAAVLLYRGPEPTPHTDRLGALGRLWYNNYHLDEFQVYLARGVTAPLAGRLNGFDQRGVDGIVNAVATVAIGIGERIRRLQTGVVGSYARVITIGITTLLVVIAVIGGWV